MISSIFTCRLGPTLHHWRIICFTTSLPTVSVAERCILLDLHPPCPTQSLSTTWMTPAPNAYCGFSKSLSYPMRSSITPDSLISVHRPSYSRWTRSQSSFSEFLHQFNAHIDLERAPSFKTEMWHSPRVAPSLVCLLKPSLVNGYWQGTEYIIEKYGRPQDKPTEAGKRDNLYCVSSFVIHFTVYWSETVDLHYSEGTLVRSIDCRLCHSYGRSQENFLTQRRCQSSWINSSSKSFQHKHHSSSGLCFGSFLVRLTSNSLCPSSRKTTIWQVAL